MGKVTLEDIKKNKEISAYISSADKALLAMGYTEHSFAHVGKTAHDAHMILTQLGYDARDAELASIAGYIHDVGNVVNRENHALSGAIMAFRLLDKMGMDATEVALVISAIGNHDEHTAEPVNHIAAALILADKSDVRRSRVRNRDVVSFDIHDRVNYAVERSELRVPQDSDEIILDITIDTSICAVMDYFEIFLGRMLLCRRAADYLGRRFRLIVNDTVIL